jgi:hypothetical protein
MPGNYDDIPRALTEMELLTQSLADYVDGFVWIPQLADSAAIMDEAVFSETARRMRDNAPNKLNLVEMPACKPEQREAWSKLADAFITQGGNGFVAVGGQRVDRQFVPFPEQWPYPYALRLGGSLADCRQWAISSLRQRYPHAFIAASGGFHHGNEANRACGFANVIVETEAFTRYGPGMARRLLQRLAERLAFLARRGEIPQTDLCWLQQQLWSDLARGQESPLSGIL